MAKRKSSGGRGFANKWKKSKQEAGEGLGDFINVDPGNYRMQLVKAEVGEYGGTLKLMTKYAVIDEDDLGALCTDFEGPLDDDDRLVWVQRLMIALGVDLDEVEIENPEDIAECLMELVEEGLAVKVRVTEKDGYLNMRVLKAIEVDEDELLDPKQALKGGSSSKSDEEDEDEDEDEEEEQKPKQKSKSKQKQKKEQDEEEEEDDDESFSKDDLAVGDQIKFLDEESGELVSAKITSIPPKGKNIQVLAEDAENDDEVELIEVGLVKEREAGEEAGEEDGEEEDGGDEIQEGDTVSWKKGRKKMSGVVRSVGEEAAKVKVPGQRKAEEVPLEDLTVEED